jgi:hypothetical protein
MNKTIYGYSAEATPATDVNPVNELTFGICTAGRKANDKAETITTTLVKDAESLSISFDGGIEEWNPMDQKGWTRRLMTSKSISVSMGGKRNYGDSGNDYVAGLAFKNGQDCNSWLSIIFPNQDQLIIPCVVNTTSMGGDSTALDALEWEVQSDGKPTYIPYSKE